MSVFISYSTKDKMFVAKLAAELIKQRIKVWVDEFEMKPGDSLVDKIQEGLNQSDFLVVVLSKNSVDSPWCKKELNSIMMSEIQEKSTRIIPILIEECTIPLFLREKLYADFRSNFEVGFSALMRSLAHLRKDKAGRGHVGGAIVDYGLHWNIVDNHFVFHIDFAIWIEKQQKSIILQVVFTGDEAATDRYKQQVKVGLSFLMKETLILVLCENENYRNLHIIASNDKPYIFTGKIHDSKNGIAFDVQVRAVLLGVESGNDIVLNFLDYIEILEETKDSRREEIWNALEKDNS